MILGFGRAHLAFTHFQRGGGMWAATCLLRAKGCISVLPVLGYSEAQAHGQHRHQRKQHHPEPGGQCAVLETWRHPGRRQH